MYALTLFFSLERWAKLDGSLTRNETQIKPVFWEVISHSSETRDASHLPVTVCVQTCLWLHPFMCVCSVILNDRLKRVKMCGRLRAFSLSLPFCLSYSASLSVSLFIHPLHSFPLISDPHPVICLVSIRKRGCDGRQAFLMHQLAFFTAPSGSSH